MHRRNAEGFNSIASRGKSHSMTKKKGEPRRSAFHLQPVPNSQTGNDYALKI